MKNKIYITGHRNPDTDSIVSTIAYANLKEKLGYDVAPIRIGNINSETSFILNKFNVPAPQLVYDIKTKVSDINIDTAISVKEDATIQEAWTVMLHNNKKVITVIDEQQKLLGMATISGITNAILSVAQSKYEHMKNTPIDNIADTLSGELIVRPRDYHPDGVITIASSLVNGQQEIDYTDKIVISSAREESQILAIKKGAALVIITRCDTVTAQTIVEATKHNCAIICTPLDLFTASQVVTQAIPVKFIMSTSLVTFNDYDYLDDVKAIIPKSRYRSYPVIDKNRKLVGLISRYHLWNHERKQLILVDHNEISQSIDGIEQADVVEVIDHHRIGDVSTNMPVMFRNETVGSCSTIITKIYLEHEIEIKPAMAGLLLGAIISDTMNFNSPTCTKVDIDIANMLSKIADININAYAREIYQASTSLVGKTLSDIVHSDLKQFTVETYNVVIGQFNIMDVDAILMIKKDLEDYLSDLCSTNRYDIAIMVFTDLTEKGSYFIWSGKDHFLFNLAFENVIQHKKGLPFIPNLLSRKQQILPMLSKAINLHTKQ